MSNPEMQGFNPENNAEITEQDIVNQLAGSIEKLAGHRIRYENEGLSKAEVHDKLVSERADFEAALNQVEAWEKTGH